VDGDTVRVTEQAPPAPAFTGIHHLKFPVTDLDASVAWFGRALGAARVAKFDHRDENGKLFAAIVQFPGANILAELRLAPDAAKAVAGYDPVTFGVAGEQALDAWIEHLDRHHIEHTDKVSGFIGTVIGVPTPDGLDIRIYTDPVGGFANAQMDYAKADIHNPELSTAKMSSFPDERS
jgi:catechol 2,3-dioxygenase-like lactoylglutathione lyase family enzyme